MEFASEMIAKSALAGLRIGQVPARLRKDGRSRSPHLRPWRDGWRHLRYMFTERMAGVQVRQSRIANTTSLETKNENCKSREGRTVL